MAFNYKKLFILFLACLLRYNVNGQATCPSSLQANIGFTTILPTSCTTTGGYLIDFQLPVACPISSLATTFTLFYTPNGCSNPTLTSVPGPGTYYIAAVPGCLSSIFIQIKSLITGSLITLAKGGSSFFPQNPNPATWEPINPVLGPTCSGTCNGQFDGYLDNGIAPYNITLTASGAGASTIISGSAGTNLVFSGLCAGNQTLSWTGANGCSQSTIIVIPTVQAISSTNFSTNPSCALGNNGTFSIAPSGGNPNYTVALIGGSSLPASATAAAVFTGLSANTYTAIITDTNACTFTTNATITDPATIIITPTSTPVNCFGTNTGGATVNANGGGGGFTYTWNPGPGSSSVISNLSVGGKTVTITDLNGCVKTQSFLITGPNSITLLPSTSSVVCFSQCNGSASVSASGPTAAVSFTWRSGPPLTVISTSSVVASLCAGTYTVFAHDVSTPPTCETTVAVLVTQPATLALGLSTVNIGCITNPCSGTASSSPSGGNGPPYTFSWTPGGSLTANVTGLCAQNYTLTVKDVSSCPISTTFAISQPSVINSGTTQTAITCNGANNGVLNSTPSGGAIPYTFTLQSSSGPISGSPPYNGLGPGTYTLFINDNSGATCPQTFAVTYTAPNVLAASITSVNILCNGANNGFLSSSPSGGTGPSYTHTWVTASGTSNGASVSNVLPGAFTYTLKDAAGCTVTSSGAITQPAALSGTITSTPVGCFSASTGILNANVVGGTGTYTYNWLPNNFTGNPNNNLPSGTYTLNLIDGNSCTLSLTQSVSPGIPITISTTTAQTQCAGSANGSATVVASGGVPTFTYSFNNSAATTNTTGICSTFTIGTYNVIVTDSNTCTQTAAITIGSPPALTSATTGVKNSCTGCTGASTMAPSGGTPPYTFAWTNSLSVNVSTATTASNLCAGPHNVITTDSKGCTSSASVQINSVVFGAAAIGAGGVLCFGACTGSAIASPSGGTPPYTYTWTPTSQTLQTAVGLCASTVYDLTIQESGLSACTSTVSFSITPPTSITVNSSTQNPTCFGLTNGQITTTVTGGNSPIGYTWTPGNINTTSLSSLPIGGYTLNLRDANGCTVSPINYSLTQTNSITAVFNTVTPTGCTLNNGTVCVTPGGGSGSGYTFAWTPTISSANCVNNVSAGTYSVVITDGAACSRTVSTNLNSPTGPTITSATSPVTCFSTSTGAATITATGSGPFNYTWSPAVVGNASVATNIPGGNYNVTVVDNNSCTTILSFSINPSVSLAVTASVVNSKCAAGVGTGSITLTVSGASPPYTYSWTSASSIPNPTLQNLTALTSGTYIVAIKDAINCSNSFTYIITAPPALTVTANSTKTVLCAGATGSITGSALGGLTPYTSFSWTPLGAFGGSITPTVFNLGAGIYSVNVVDANGCSAASPATWTLAASTLTASINQLSTTCTNSNNASATITASGGSPAYTYTWSFGASTSSVLSSIGVGSFVGTVNDVDGCSVSKSFTITPASNFTVSLVPSNPKCNGASTGSITTTPTGGVGTINYVWSPSGTGQSPTGLNAGPYSLIATDANNCQALGLTTLINPAVMFANVSVVTNPACAGNCNGVAVSNPTNGTSPFTFVWFPAAANSATNSGLCVGTNYSVTVTDVNGCTDNASYTVTSPSSLNINPSSVPPTCSSLTANGSISLAVSGGSAPYTFTWSPNVSTTSSATALTAQVYVVTVKDNANCTNSVTIPLSNSNGPTAPITSTNNNCFGQCIGAASVGVIVSGTATTLPAVWILPAPSVTANSISNLCTVAGGYTVQLEDSNGCKTFTGTNITQGSSITINPSLGLPTCNGICNGSATLNAVGGVGPFTYSWNPSGPTGSLVANLCANPYTVTVGYNAGACTQTQLVNVPPTISLSFTDNLTHNTCFGNCNGVATVSVINTPGIPSPFAFSWNTGQTSAGPLVTSINGLCSQVYSVTATGVNGCFSTYALNISSPSQLTYSSTIVQPSCGVCNGVITTTASGGTGSSYTYLWNNASTSSSIANACAAIYIFTLTDAIGCTQGQTITLNNSNGISTPTFTPKNIACGSTCSGAATVIATSSNMPISYNWVNPATSGTVISNLCPQTYFVQMVDAQGCVRTDSVSISAATSITINPTVHPPPCGPLTTGSISVVVSGGTPGYNITWFPSLTTGTALNNIGPGTYSVDVNDASALGCLTSSVFNISSINAPTVSFNLKNIDCFGQCTGAATAVVTGTGAPFSYNWSSVGNINNVSGLCKGAITVTVTDSQTCIAVSSSSISENPQLQLNTPNVVQPSCGQCNGSATLVVFGGLAPYTYLWPDNTTNSVNIGLCANIIPVQIMDSKNCSVTPNISINNSNGISGATITTQDIPCGNSSTGSATIFATSPNNPVTYQWLNPVSSNSVISNLSPTVYIVQIQDASGCILTKSASILAATSMSLNPIIQLPKCGVSNGKIILAVAGGTPSYSYTWFPTAPNTGTLNNIGPGSYSLTVSDSSPLGCSTNTVFTISNLNAPAINFVSTNVDCFGLCTGAATANVTGTATPFSYNWSVGGNSSSVSNLCNSVITLSVTDSNTCVSVKSLSITENPQLQINTPSPFQPSCNVCNGSVTVSAFGGVLPYTYLWNNSTTGASQSSLCAGVFPFQVTDSKGCIQTLNVLINNSNGISGATLTTKDIPCGNTCSGAATIIATSPNNPVTYQWLNPASSNSVITNLCVQNYMVQIQDATGCIMTKSANIIASTNMSISPSVQLPLCGSNNGKIILAVSGGTPSYNYTWFPTAPNSATLSNIGPGTYSLTVADSSPLGCSTNTVFTISNLNAPAINFVSNNVDCFGQCTGAATANVTGTATPFTYNWNVGGSSSTITNLCKSVVTLSVTDSNTCVAVKTLSISENPLLQINTPAPTQPSCNKCNGSVVVSAFGGLLPYSYTWNNNSTGASQSSMCAGAYQVQITDSKGCKQTQNLIINNSNGITGHTFSVQNIQCANQCNGAATVIPQGGTTPISFSWINPALTFTNSNANGLCAGDYFVQMIDAVGCIRTASTSITPASSITLIASNISPSCSTSNGVITLSVSGGNSPYTYSWNPVATNTSVLTGLAAGTYTAIVSDNSGCIKTQIITLSSLNGPSFSLTKKDVDCFGTCTGAATAVVTGTAATTFNWSTGSAATSVSNLCKGIITLTASANGCSTINNYTISEKPQLIFNANLIDVSCANKCDGQVSLLPLGGTMTYSFASTQTLVSNMASNLCSGLYTFTVTDAVGCSVTNTAQVDNASNINSILSFTNSSCASVPDASASIIISGGRPTYSLSWTGPSAFTSTQIALNSILSGNYSLSITDNSACKKDTVLTIKSTIEVDANAGLDSTICPRNALVINGTKSTNVFKYAWILLPNTTATIATTASFSIPEAVNNSTYVLIGTSSVASCVDRDSVIIKLYNEPLVDAGPSYTIPVYSNVQIGGNPTNTGTETINWLPLEGLSDPTSPNPIASNTVNTAYTVTVKYGKGCVAMDSMQVILFPEIIVNSGFSPNNDGNNDKWQVDYIDQFPDNEVEIFNRWGDRIFYSKGYQNPWDGMYKGKNLPVGTYYYVIKLNHPGYPKPYTGPVTIFR